MTSLLPDALSDTQRFIGLVLGFALIAWGLGAAAWHIWIGEKLTWRSRLLGRGPTKQQIRDRAWAETGTDPTDEILSKAKDSLEFGHYFDEAAAEHDSKLD